MLEQPATTPQVILGSIKFPHTWLARTRTSLLSDLSKEQFCILLGKRHDYASGFVINVLDALNPGAEAYTSHSLGHVSPRKDFVLYALSELSERLDVDCLIDVHTHPFSKGGVNFSGTDDADEVKFFHFLSQHFENFHYASIVFSQSEYSARLWHWRSEKPVAAPLRISAPTVRERIPNSHLPSTTAITSFVAEDNFLHRTTLAIGQHALSAIVSTSTIVVVGLGGLGSAIAENLVHMGFNNLVLIDPDIVESSNLNRIVGARWQDAVEGIHKVHCVTRHLESINPNIVVRSITERIEDALVDGMVADADWMFIATDSHSSRFHAQEICFKFFIPFISAGVGITVKGDRVVDYSGEVIVVRPGDRLCLTCLNRLNPTKIAAESNVDTRIRDTIVGRGYVTGSDVKEPAVKTLNAVISAIAVEELVNQYTHRTEEAQVIVYERNARMSIYRDTASIEGRYKECATCGIVR